MYGDSEVYVRCIPRRPRLACNLPVYFLLIVVWVTGSVLGCGGTRNWWATVPGKPHFSCENLARWSQRAKEDKAFREKVEKDPFPHASQLGLSNASGAGRVVSTR
jgi:hypothetical protein